MINKNNLSIDHFINAPVISSNIWKGYDIERRDHLMYAMTKVSILGDMVEFGVYQGKTVTQIANFFTDRKIWGFDSFEGLPEDWFLVDDAKSPKFPKGAFGMSRLPVVPGNVTLIKGWFDDTIGPWKEKNSGAISLLHIDCDLYSSSIKVLTELDQQIVPGTVIVFDEMYHWADPKNYDLWHQGEYRALQEWVSGSDREFEIISRNQYMQCSIVVRK